nr:MAG TPA: hypothetical protein [Caudoviricetes sp.]
MRYNNLEDKRAQTTGHPPGGFYQCIADTYIINVAAHFVND